MSRGTPIILTIEIGGHEIDVHGLAYPGDPGQTSGPPERCWPPELPEFEAEKFLLSVPVTDDLSPNPRTTRIVHLDITDFLSELDSATVDRLVEEAFDRWEPEEP